MDEVANDSFLVPSGDDEGIAFVFGGFWLSPTAAKYPKHKIEDAVAGQDAQDGKEAGEDQLNVSLRGNGLVFGNSIHDDVDAAKPVEPLDDGIPNDHKILSSF